MSEQMMWLQVAFFLAAYGLIGTVVGVLLYRRTDEADTGIMGGLFWPLGVYVLLAFAVHDWLDARDTRREGERELKEKENG